MLSRRIIACLDVREGRVVKGVRFRDHVDVGDIAELALRYRGQGADELVFYDIGASPEGRSVDYRWVERVSALLDIPFCVAGGIRSVATARAVLNAGADKVSINTPALERPQLIAELAEAFGAKGIRCDDPADLDDAIMEMIAYDGPVIFDCLVEKHENCFPMIPSGAPHNKMLLGEDSTKDAIGATGAVMV